MKGETLADFADDLKYLAYKVYAELEEAARDCITLSIYLTLLDNPVVAFPV